jgi:hypothetical protein
MDGWDGLKLSARQDKDLQALLKKFSTDRAKLSSELVKLQAQHDRYAPFVADVKQRGLEGQKRYQSRLKKFEDVKDQRQKKAAAIGKLEGDTEDKAEAILTKTQRRDLLAGRLKKEVPEVKFEATKLTDKQVEALTASYRAHRVDKANFDALLAKNTQESWRLLLQPPRGKASYEVRLARGQRRINNESREKTLRLKEKARKEFAKEVEKLVQGTK